MKKSMMTKAVAAIATAALAATPAMAAAQAPTSAGEAMGMIAEAELATRNLNANLSIDVDATIAATVEEEKVEIPIMANANGEASVKTVENAPSLGAKIEAALNLMGEETKLGVEAYAFEENGKTKTAVGNAAESGELEWTGSSTDGSLLSDALAQASEADLASYFFAFGEAFEMTDDGSASGEIVLEGSLGVDDLEKAAKVAEENGGSEEAAAEVAQGALDQYGALAGGIKADVKIVAGADDHLLRSIGIDMSGADWSAIASLIMDGAEVEVRSANANVEFARDGEALQAPKDALNAIDEANAESSVGMDVEETEGVA